jgi:hypothetical protein
MVVLGPLTKEGVFSDPAMKLLLFTKKDTWDRLAGDGREDRPLDKPREGGLH